VPQEPGERWPTTRSLTCLATIFALRVILNRSTELYDRADYARAWPPCKKDWRGGFRSGEGRVTTPEETTV
jgi:hypothetical protein